MVLVVAGGLSSGGGETVTNIGLFRGVGGGSISHDLLGVGGPVTKSAITLLIAKNCFANIEILESVTPARARGVGGPVGSGGRGTAAIVTDGVDDGDANTKGRGGTNISHLTNLVDSNNVAITSVSDTRKTLGQIIVGSKRD